MSLRNVRVSPSEFAFMFDECKRCFWLRYGARQPEAQVKRPRTPFPSIFSKLDTGTTAALMGLTPEETQRCIDEGVASSPKSFEQKHACAKAMMEIAERKRTPLSSISASLPDCRVVGTQEWVESKPMAYPDLGVSVAVGGYYDLLLAYPDGSLEITDLKTTEIDERKLEKYQRQLLSYAYALGRPSQGEPRKVSTLSLIVWEPLLESVAFQTADSTATFGGPVRHLPVEKDNALFSATMRGVAELVALKEAPEGAARCSFCQYARALGVAFPMEGDDQRAEAW